MQPQSYPKASDTQGLPQVTRATLQGSPQGPHPASSPTPLRSTLHSTLKTTEGRWRKEFRLTSGRRSAGSRPWAPEPPQPPISHSCTVQWALQAKAVCQACSGGSKPGTPLLRGVEGQSRDLEKAPAQRSTQKVAGRFCSQGLAGQRAGTAGQSQGEGKKPGSCPCVYSPTTVPVGLCGASWSI